MALIPADRSRALEWLKRFVPEPLRSDPEAARRGQLTVVVSMTLAVACPAFAAVAFFGYHLGVIAAIDVAGAVLGLVAPFVLRSTRSLAVASSLVLGVTVLTISLAAASVEGLTSPALAWLALVPILSSALGGRRPAAIWAGVCTLAIVAMLALDHFALLPNQELPVEQRRLASAWNFALMFGVALAFSALYETLHLRALAALNAARGELEKAREQAALNERMASLGRLAEGMANELNAPSTNVAGSVRLARDTVALVRSGSVPASELGEVEAALSKALHNANQVTDAVRDLKTLGNGEQGRTAGVDVADVMDVSLRLVGNLLRPRATVHKNLSHVPSLVANEAQLSQVFVNLLTNAADAMPRRPLAQNLITVTTRLRNGEVCVEVQDNGVGIAPEVLPRIFDPFFSTKSQGKGSGLGLSICRSVVEQHQGRIEVESMPGVGSTFRVLLPAAKAVAPRLRVLVIDDDLLMCRALERLLGARHHVEHHQSANEALSRPDLDRFDVILCDLMMPELNGPDFYERVQKTLPQVAPRIGFMSGGAVGADALQPAALRGRLVDKPLEGEKLEALLAALSGRTNLKV